MTIQLKLGGRKMAGLFALLAQISFWAIWVDFALGVLLTLIHIFTKIKVENLIAITLGFYFVVTIFFVAVLAINIFCFHSFPW